MIYTITLNPSLDYFMMVNDELIEDEVNRSINEEYKAGGKGLNVSKILSLYGYSSKAIAVLGGFTGEYIKEYYANVPNVCFIPINTAGITRINVKILGQDKALCVNGNGVIVNKDTEERILNVLDSIDEADYVMICGKMAKGFSDDFIKLIADKVNIAKAKLIIDMESIDIEMIKYCKPYLIKPNLYELGIIMHEENITLNNLKENADKLLNAGLKTILVSLGKDGAYYSDGKINLKVNQPVVKAINKVGCGDAMLGSFIGKLANNKNIEECLKFAISAGCATASKVEDITLDDITHYYSDIKILPF